MINPRTCSFCGDPWGAHLSVFHRITKPLVSICGTCVTYAFLTMQQHDREEEEHRRQWHEHLDELRWEAEGGVVV